MIKKIRESDNFKLFSESFLPLIKKIYKIFFLLIALIFIGAFVFVHLEGFTFLDSVWYVVVTLTTVGYGDVSPQTTQGKIAGLLLILIGVGILGFAIGSISNFILEGHIKNIFNDLSMKKKINKLKNHMIICGLGPIGVKIAEEFLITKVPFVAIEKDEEAVAKATHVLNEDFLCIKGDATEDQVLIDAGISNAKAIAISTRNDQDNLFLVVSARDINPDIKIISMAVNESSIMKIKKAGADEVVGPNLIGGMRAASVMIRPKVVTFLDRMLRENSVTRFEEIEIGKKSKLIGKNLFDLYKESKVNISIAAIKKSFGNYIYSNHLFENIEEGDTLIVIGEEGEISNFKKEFN